MSALSILMEEAKKTGWDEHSMIHILCEYIDNQKSLDSFAEHVSTCANADLAFNAELNGD